MRRRNWLFATLLLLLLTPASPSCDGATLSVNLYIYGPCGAPNVFDGVDGFQVDITDRRGKVEATRYLSRLIGGQQELGEVPTGENRMISVRGMNSPQGDAALMVSGSTGMVDIVPPKVGNALNLFVFVAPPASFYSTSTDPRFFQSVDGCTTLVNKRAGHRATILKDGRVLITGGAEFNANGVPATPVRWAELFDPQTGLWDSDLKHPKGGVQEPGMNNTRAFHTAALLDNGQVLIAGGESLINNLPATLSTAEIFDPQSKSFKFISPMKNPRSHHTATPLGGGKVLITGGMVIDQQAGRFFVDTAEIYASGSFQQISGPLAEGRADHTATQVMIDTGSKVVVGGGRNATQVLSSIEIYDPDAQGFRMPSEFVAGFTDNITTARSHHTAVGLPGPAVAFVGGFTKALSDASMLTSIDVTSSIEIYSLQTGTIINTKQLGNARAGHCADFLPDGRVLVSGGFGGQQGVLSSVEAIKPGELSGEITVTPIGAMTSPRFFHSCTLLTTGMTLIAGGGGGNAVDMTLGTSELYNP